MKSYKIVNFNILGLENSPLIALEKGKDIPFEIKRIYYIFNTDKDVQRGFHAHRNLKQIAIAVKGSCTFVLDDGDERNEIQIDNPKIGIFIEGIIWREIKNFSEDCVILVIASENYDENDYIRNYDEFLALVNLEKK
tara:strand:+ start:1549 stop:1959 length:411 start_codon:yes stop_codon:yes gene_type:complete